MIETTKNSSGEVIMRALFSAAFAAAFLLSGPALADEAKPVDQSQLFQLTAAQMDTVTAGNLLLPNGETIFLDFDNPAPGDFHPTFHIDFGGRRSNTAAAATFEYNGPVVDDPTASGGNEGAWSAGVKSPVISITGL